MVKPRGGFLSILHPQLTPAQQSKSKAGSPCSGGIGQLGERQVTWGLASASLRVEATRGWMSKEMSKNQN